MIMYISRPKESLYFEAVSLSQCCATLIMTSCYNFLRFYRLSSNHKHTCSTCTDTSDHWSTSCHSSVYKKKEVCYHPVKSDASALYDIDLDKTDEHIIMWCHSINKNSHLDQDSRSRHSMNLFLLRRAIPCVSSHNVCQQLLLFHLYWAYGTLGKHTN